MFANALKLSNWFIFRECCARSKAFAEPRKPIFAVFKLTIECAAQSKTDVQG